MSDGAKEKTLLEKVLPLADAGKLARRLVLAEVLGPPRARRKR